jgi:hypothetical protein
MKDHIAIRKLLAFEKVRKMCVSMEAKNGRFGVYTKTTRPSQKLSNEFYM